MLLLFQNHAVRAFFIAVWLLSIEGCAAQSIAAPPPAVPQIQSASSADAPSKRAVTRSGESPSIISASPAAVRSALPAKPAELSAPATQLTAAIVSSNAQTKLKLLLDRLIDALFGLDRREWVGIGIFAAMLVFYYLEERSSLFSLAFAVGCLAGAAYAFVNAQRAIAIAAGVWGLVAMRKSWRRNRVKRDGLSRGEQFALAWFVRVIGILAVSSGVTLLIADSPISFKLLLPVSHSMIEAIPLLLIGVAYLAWLATEKPTALDLFKQILIAAAFILWGADLLMPPGQWARFVGAVVIAIYVFDLAWLIEGNLRNKLRARWRGESQTAASVNGGERHWSGDIIGVHEDNGGRSHHPKVSGPPLTNRDR